MRDQLTKLSFELNRHPVSTMCFAVGVVALASALVGATISYFLAEVMSVLGMLAVAIFYLGLGTWHRLTPMTNTNKDASQWASFERIPHHSRQAAIDAVRGERWESVVASDSHPVAEAIETASPAQPEKKPSRIPQNR